MKQVVRALGWATSIFWIILLLFTVTAVYSAFQIRPEFGDPSVSTSGDTLILSLPFGLYNGGFYDISRLNITTVVSDNHGSAISSASTFVTTISRGENTSITHNMSLSIGQMASSDLSFLLFNDSELNVTAILRLTYANAFPFEITANISMPWGAPLANPAIGGISIAPFNSTHVRAFAPVSFENHSYLEMSGTMRLEIVDGVGHVAGEGATIFYAPSENRFETIMEVLLSDSLANIREARLHFQTPFFTYGPVVIPLV
jgi:hypothetical protein